MAESLTVAMILAVTGGFLDIYTYLARGRVFANTQTGNLVLLGYNLANANGRQVLYYLFPIIFFMLGTALAKVVEIRFYSTRKFIWMHVTIGLEMAVLALVALIPDGELNVIANIMISFVCGLQVQTFRKVNGNAYSTMMFTGNLKNAAERMSHYFITGDKEALANGIVYLVVIVMFIAGACSGDLIISYFGVQAVLFADILLGIIFIILYAERCVDKRKNKQKTNE